MKRSVANDILRNNVLDTIKIDAALYRLLINFLASPEIAKMISSDKYDEFALNQLIDEFQENEILESLIYSATFLRVADDLQQVKPNHMKQVVGKLNTGKSLTLREACNKIIHAEHLKYDIAEQDNVEYLNPTIHLFGKYRGRKWNVTIEIKRYVEVAHLALGL